MAVSSSWMVMSGSFFSIVVTFPVVDGFNGFNIHDMSRHVNLACRTY